MALQSHLSGAETKAAGRSAMLVVSGSGAEVLYIKLMRHRTLPQATWSASSSSDEKVGDQAEKESSPGDE